MNQMHIEIKTGQGRTIEGKDKFNQCWKESL
jgi:hypothetical protein